MGARDKGVTRRPTISDVASLAGVSIGAVSLAMNGRGGVGPETAQRIRDAAAELGWIPSMRARSLSRSRAQAVGMVILRPAELLGADPFFSHLMAGVEAVLAERDNALLIRVAGDAAQEQQAYKALVAEGRIDGVLLTDVRTPEPRYALLDELRLPAVVVGRPGSGCALPAVGTDDRAPLRELVEHLISLGHRRIAYVGGVPGLIHTRARQRAWRDSMAVAGMAVDLQRVGGFTPAGGAAATRDLLARTDRPTAIVYANDLMAIAGIGVARGLGVHVPAALSVTGFDDVSLAAHVSPPLTTVRRDTQAWGQRAAELLLDAIDGVDVPVRVTLPSAVVVRESTAVAPKRRAKGTR